MPADHESYSATRLTQGRHGYNFSTCISPWSTGLWQFRHPQLFTEQLIAHVTTILRYGPNQQDPTGSLLHVTSKAMQLEVGYNGKLLAAPLLLADNVTASWIKHMWASTQEAGVTISTNFAEVQPQ